MQARQDYAAVLEGIWQYSPGCGLCSLVQKDRDVDRAIGGDRGGEKIDKKKIKNKPNSDAEGERARHQGWNEYLRRVAPNQRLIHHALGRCVTQ
jgi:hypothetical protein